MRVKCFAALTGGGTDRDDPAAFLRDHVRDGIMNHGVDALQVDLNHFVPLTLGQFFDRRVLLVPDACVGDENVEAAEAVSREVHEFFGVGHFAQVGLQGFDARTVLAGFLLHLRGCFLAAVVVEHDVRAGLREKFYSGGSDAAGASGNQCSLACERNHFSPDEWRVEISSEFTVKNCKLDSLNLKPCTNRQRCAAAWCCAAKNALALCARRLQQPTRGTVTAPARPTRPCVRDATARRRSSWRHRSIRLLRSRRRARAPRREDWFPVAARIDDANCSRGLSLRRPTARGA